MGGGEVESRRMGDLYRGGEAKRVDRSCAMDTFTTLDICSPLMLFSILASFLFVPIVFKAPLSKPTNGSKKALRAATIEHLLKWHSRVKLKPAHDQIDTNTTTTGNGYDSMSDLGEIRVYQRADFQSGSRVLKKVF